MNRQTLAAGEVIFEFGGLDNDVCRIVSGTVDVSVPTGPDRYPVAQLNSGAVIGEIAALAGGRRTATVTAVTEVVVDRYERSEFNDWLAANPSEADAIVAASRRRLNRTRVCQAVAELVGPEHPELVAEIAEQVEWVTLEAGDLLFDQHDTADSAYVVVSGRIAIQAVQDGRITIDARVGRGELVGEIGVIESAPRAASARATRDCTLARIKKTDFEALVARHPAIMGPVARTVISRLGTHDRPHPHVGLITIVSTAGPLPDGFVTGLVAEAARFGTAMHLDAAVVDELLQHPGAAHAEPGTVAGNQLAELIHEVDVANRWVVLEGDRLDSSWTSMALRGADRVVIVASTQPDRHELDQIRAAIESINCADRDVWLVRTIPDDPTPPSGAAELLDATGADRIVAIRTADPLTHRRLARLMTGNGTGVALSGGGARAFGQIGALQALAEHGIEIDALAGTSMGSVVAGFTAVHHDTGRAESHFRAAFGRRRLLDYTLPFTSLISARRITESIEHTCGPWDIEDTVIPVAVVSTNLTTAEAVVHLRGSLAKAIRASVSLPGVFPPVVDGDELLIDGGVLQNLPVQPLIDDPAVSTVIAVDVSPPTGPRARHDYGQAISGFRILGDRLLRRGRRYPALANTVVQSMLVGSSQARQRARDNESIDLYMHLDLRGVRLLDFTALDDAAARGYDEALPLVKTWLDQGQPRLVNADPAVA